MPRIPLAEIPNAPQVAAPVVTDPGAIRAPNISRVAGTLVQGTLDQGAYDGAAQGAQAIAQGLQALGGAGSKVAGVMQDWQARKTKINDAIAQTQRDAERRAYVTEFEGRKATIPPGQWEVEFEKGLPDLEKRIGEYALSPESSALDQAEHSGWLLKSKASVMAAGTQQAISDGKALALAEIDAAAQVGDYEKVFTTITRNVDAMIFSPADALEIETKIKGRQQDDALAAAQASNPAAARADLEKGDTDAFGPMPETKRKMWTDRFARQERQNDQEDYYAAQDGIAAGDLNTVEDVKKAYPQMSPRKLKLVERQFASYRDFDPATDGPLFAEVRAKIANYDGSLDPKGEKSNEIDDMISRLPKREQGRLQSAFQQVWSSTWKDGKEKPLKDKQLGYWMAEMERLGKAGYLGPTGRDRDKWETVKDPAQSAAYGQLLMEKQDQLEQWFRQNGEASPDQAREAFAKIVGPDAAKASAGAWRPTFGQSRAWGITTLGPQKGRSLDELAKEVDGAIALPTADPNNVVPR